VKYMLYGAISNISC